MMSASLLPLRVIRDLSVLEIHNGRVLIVACDSIGSIGPKSGDTYPATPETVAHFAARVPLLEVLCAGGVPQLIVDTLNVEMDPTGSAMIEEIRRVATGLGLGADRVTGSTEDNVTSRATGIGVTVIGSANSGDLRPGTSRSGDAVVCLGVPTSAPQDVITIGDARMLSIVDLVAVVARKDIRDALPVGSKGVAYEANQLAESAGLLFMPAADVALDLAKTGGPASCVLVTMAETDIESLRSILPPKLPVTVVGTLVQRQLGA